MSQIVELKPKTAIEKRTNTVTDTIMVTQESIHKWKAPPFQRPLKANKKVVALAETLKQDNGIIPGIITLGVLDGETYLLDGQHRIAAFLMAEIKEGFTDIRKHFFETMAEMGDEWVNLNSQLVRMGPDDILRGLEASTPTLQLIRRKCNFVAYDQIRRSPTAPVLSMSVAIRSWRHASKEVPSWGGGGSAKDALQEMLLDDAEDLCTFLNLALAAFGRDKEYGRLWGGLNLTLCMWLYRRMVLVQWSAKVPRMHVEMFKKCLTSLSSSTDYLDWLVGRGLTDRDRAPAYNRIRKIFVSRVMQETGQKITMPQPTWANV